MDLSRIKTAYTAFISKYKYVVLVLLIGILLMLVPKQVQSDVNIPQEEQSAVTESVAGKLERILSQVDGVGKVRVMLTEANDGEVRYQMDEDLSSDGSARRDTVIITDSSRAEEGLVRVTFAPVYRGAVVVCQGADSPQVRLAVTEAVVNATGLSSDRITVLKMK